MNDMKEKTSVYNLNKTNYGTSFVNSKCVSNLITSVLRIKNKRLHKKMLQTYKNGCMKKSYTCAYEYLCNLIASKPQLSHTLAIIQDRKITYADMINEVDTLAYFLHCKLRCEKGELVSVCAASSIEGIVAFFALNKLGLVNARIFNGSKREKMLSNLNTFESKTVFTDMKNLQTILKVIDKTRVENIIVMDSVTDDIKKSVSDYTMVNIFAWNEIMDMQADEDYTENVNSDDLASILYTSGSSGVPKPIAIANRVYTNMINIVLQTTGIKSCDGEKVIAVVSHEYPYAAINCTIMILLMGKTLIMPVHNEDGKIDFQKLLLYKPERIQAIPNFYKLFEEYYALHMGEELGYLKNVVSGGETYTESEKKKLLTFLKCRKSRPLLIDGFGFGEMGSATALKFGLSDYFLLMNGIEAKAVDEETNKELGLDREGVLCITGPTIANGYFKDYEGTKKSFIVDESGKTWFKSDTYGIVHGKDRRLIRLGGRVREYFITEDGEGNFVKVYAGRVEDVIASHKDIKDCVVVPSDNSAAPKVVAYISLNANCTSNTNEIISSLKIQCEELENFAQPSIYIIQDNIRRTEAGKKDYGYYKSKSTSAE